MNNVFSLLDEPWIQVSYVDGHIVDVSLRRIFRDAPKIKGLSGDIPQQNLPLLRLFIAILYRAYLVGDTDEDQMRELWREIFFSGRFDMKIIEKYLDKWGNRFYLMGERPFFQVPNLKYVGEKLYDPVSEIIADVPKPEKYLFSMRGKGAADSLSLAEAARWLIFKQAYDIAGIKSLVRGYTHAHKETRAIAPKNLLKTGWLGSIGGLFVEGHTLFETMMFNWVLYDTRYDSERYRLFGNENDIPVWERDKVPSSDMDDCSRFMGPVQILTWQSRRIRLVPNEDRSKIIGVVSCYGDVTETYNSGNFEKMTAWKKIFPNKKELGIYTPVKHDASRALWRGLESILCTSGENDCRPGIIRWMEEIRTEILESEDHALNLVTIHAQGMVYHDKQSSTFETGIDDAISLNMVLLRHDYAGITSVIDVVKCTDKAVLALVRLVRNLRVAAGDQGKLSDKTVEQIRENAYAELDELFRDKLAAFDESQDPIEYSNVWKDEVHRQLLNLCQDYFDQSPMSIFNEHEVPNSNKKKDLKGPMSAARAQLLYRIALDKELGVLKWGSLTHSDEGRK